MGAHGFQGGEVGKARAAKAARAPTPAMPAQTRGYQADRPGEAPRCKQESAGFRHGCCRRRVHSGPLAPPHAPQQKPRGWGPCPALGCPAWTRGGGACKDGRLAVHPGAASLPQRCLSPGSSSSSSQGWPSPRWCMLVHTCVLAHWRVGACRRLGTKGSPPGVGVSCSRGDGGAGCGGVLGNGSLNRSQN